MFSVVSDAQPAAMALIDSPVSSEHHSTLSSVSTHSAADRDCLDRLSVKLQHTVFSEASDAQLTATALIDSPVSLLYFAT